MPNPKDIADNVKAIAKDANTAADDGTSIIKKAAELTGGSIHITIDSQSKEGERDPEECQCPNVQPYQREVMRLTHRAFLQRWLKPSSFAVRLTIGVRWQGDGCSVIGARPYIGSDSCAGFGTSVTGTIQAVPSAFGRPQEACDCCSRATCVEFAVSLSIQPMIGSTSVKSGHIIVCANGEVGAEWQ